MHTSRYSPRHEPFQEDAKRHKILRLSRSSWKNSFFIFSPFLSHRFPTFNFGVVNIMRVLPARRPFVRTKPPVCCHHAPARYVQKESALITIRGTRLVQLSHHILLTSPLPLARPLVRVKSYSATFSIAFLSPGTSGVGDAILRGLQNGLVVYNFARASFYTEKFLGWS